MSVGVEFGVGGTGVGGIGVGSTGAAVGVAVKAGVLMANVVGLGDMVRFGDGVEVGPPPQATDINRTTDKTNIETWSFTISSSVRWLGHTVINHNSNLDRSLLD